MTNKPWQNIRMSDLQNVSEIYTMLSFEEEQILFFYASQLQGQGVILDLGSFLGGSAARMAAGAMAGQFQPMLHLYDWFLFHDKDMKEHVPEHLHALGNDDNLVRHLLKPHYSNFQIHKGPVAAQIWHGEPVEILFNDITKSLRVLDHVTQQFYPSLIPDVSILIQQEMLFERTPWIAAHMELWADKFEYIGHSEQDSVVFKLTERITPEEAEERAMQPLFDAEISVLMDMALERAKPLGYAAHIKAQMKLIQEFGVFRSTRELNNLKKTLKKNSAQAL